MLCACSAQLDVQAPLTQALLSACRPPYAASTGTTCVHWAGHEVKEGVKAPTGEQHMPKRASIDQSRAAGSYTAKSALHSLVPNCKMLPLDLMHVT